ncbi:MAG: hypothetical protein QOJ23_112 [Actinomycetota bacterium]|jgi:hypothetical protein|nr:hypothetical protein [Actinomycetota bacterium]MDQ1497931.1 hypothetical protein [Actinomycetota bacterium]MDQ1568920.1 hypothetical protein [Actinomycetota bacterium]
MADWESVCRRSTLGLSLLMTTLSVVLHAPGFVVRLVNSDEASLASMAMVINRGGTLYHRIADRKPPVVPYLYAGVFRLTGTADIRYVRFVAAVALGLTASLLTVEAFRRSGSRGAGLGCGVLFLFAVTAFFPDDSQAAGFEIFMLLPMTATVVLAGRRRYIGAGVALAIACLCKQTAVTTALPAGWLCWQNGGRAALGRLAAGAVAPIAVTAAFFGPAPFLLWTVTGTGGYLALQGSWGAALSRAAGMTGALAGLEISLVVLIAIALRRRSATVDLWLWLAGGAVAVTAGLRFFGHYYLQLLPPAALIAAPVLATAPAVGRRLALAGVALPAAVCAGVGFVPTGDSATIPYRPLATAVRKVTDRDDTVFVWGNVPEIYCLSGREPATRFIHTGFLTGNSGGRPNGRAGLKEAMPGAWTMLAADFRAKLPDLVVDTTGGDIRQSAYYPMSSTWLWPLVQGNYRLIDTLDGVRFYILKTVSA